MNAFEQYLKDIEVALERDSLDSEYWSPEMIKPIVAQLRKCREQRDSGSYAPERHDAELLALAQGEGK